MNDSSLIPTATASPRWLWPWVWACAVLCVLLSHVGGLRNSVTFDETLHAVSAHAARHDLDFRLNPEDPPLWMYWANLPHPRGALPISNEDPSYIHVIDLHGHHWDYCSELLFPPGDANLTGHAFVAASRWMMVPLAGVVVLLASLIASKLAPAATRTIATAATSALVAFEPTLLGHASIVKNDVTMTCVWLGLTLCLMNLCRRLSLRWMLATAVCVAIGPCVKFTGVLGAQLLVLVLLGRAVLGGPWAGQLLGRPVIVSSRLRRLIAAVVICLFCAAMTVTMIWAAYGFRFAATSDTARPLLNTPEHVMTARKFTAVRQIGHNDPSLSQMMAVTLPAPIRLALAMEQNQLLPQAWLTGFIYTYASTMYRVNYVLGEPTLGGTWFYFLVAPIFKLPLGILALFPVASFAALMSFFRPAAGHDRAAPWHWSVAMTSVGLYLIVAMTSDMNIGIRHLLPIIPLSIALAVTAVARLSRHGRNILLGAVLLTAVESVASVDRYLSFFNLPSRVYGPARLLGDSNLDWGQDLLRLREWQRDNPDTPLYLLYFGTARPEAYGLKFVRLPGTRFSSQPEELPSKPGVIVASQMHMLGYPLPKPLRDAYAPLRAQQPIGRIGDSLLVYPFPPRSAGRASSSPETGGPARGDAPSGDSPTTSPTSSPPPLPSPR